MLTKPIKNRWYKIDATQPMAVLITFFEEIFDQINGR